MISNNTFPSVPQVTDIDPANLLSDIRNKMLNLTNSRLQTMRSNENLLRAQEMFGKKTNKSIPLKIEMTRDMFANRNHSAIISRKIAKTCVEKKRRDRINRCLDELKELMAVSDERARYQKLEKAEILEMTVEYLKKSQMINEEARQKASLISSTTSLLLKSFETNNSQMEIPQYELQEKLKDILINAQLQSKVCAISTEDTSKPDLSSPMMETVKKEDLSNTSVGPPSSGYCSSPDGQNISQSSTNSTNTFKRKRNCSNEFSDDKVTAFVTPSKRNCVETENGIQMNGMNLEEKAQLILRSLGLKADMLPSNETIEQMMKMKESVWRPW
ncbi:hypothetical protein SNEBB_004403 [Seison nebaliae]|nr:hypothetical protein SNEBB_004403 [Seison nebaliae]